MGYLHEDVYAAKNCPATCTDKGCAVTGDNKAKMITLTPGGAGFRVDSDAWVCVVPCSAATANWGDGGGGATDVVPSAAAVKLMEKNIMDTMTPDECIPRCLNETKFAVTDNKKKWTDRMNALYKIKMDSMSFKECAPRCLNKTLLAASNGKIEWEKQLKEACQPHVDHQIEKPSFDDCNATCLQPHKWEDEKEKDKLLKEMKKNCKNCPGNNPDPDNTNSNFTTTATTCPPCNRAVSVMDSNGSIVSILLLNTIFFTLKEKRLLR